MASIARRNLFQDKARLAISVGGVGFAVFLMLVIQALYQGWSERMGSYVANIDADVWVLQLGTTDMFHSYSLVSKSLEPTIREVPGVIDVAPFIGRRIRIEVNGEERAMYLIGVDPANPINGPKQLVEGSLKPGDGEIIIDNVFAARNKVHLGDTLTINNHPLRVSGIVSGGNMIVFQYAFTSQAEAERVLHLGAPPEAAGMVSATTLPPVTSPDVANYLLVKTAPGRAAEVRDALAAKLPDQLFKTKTEFADDNSKFIRESFLPIIYVLTVIGFLTGIAIVGLTIYTATAEKSQEYGVLKAIGASNLRLYGIVAQQSLVAAVLGYVVGAGAALSVSPLIERFEPAFVTLYRPSDVAFVFVASLVMSILASYVPLRAIVRIDPAKVFRA